MKPLLTDNTKNSVLKKRWFRWLTCGLILYIVIGIGFYFFQEKILFHPTELPRNYQYHFNVPFKEVDIGFNNTDTMNMVQFFPAQINTKGVVLYFHGNKANINRYAKFAQNFTKQGYEVWMPDYPGYGKSVGVRTEQNMYLQAMELFDMANKKYKSDSIIVFGKSLGTGIASYVAAHHACKQLILETPYFSIPDLFNTWVPIYPHRYSSVYKFPVNEYLQLVKYPITIFHGTNDWVVPYRCAVKLKSFLKPTDKFITINGGSHKNLNTYPLFHHTLDSLLQLP